MSWIYLIIAGILEAVWAIGLKYTDGFSRLGPSVLVGLAIAGSMFFLALSLRTIPIATGYAIWVSIGVVGATIFASILLDQGLRPIQLVFLGLLIVSIIGLKLTASAQ